MSKRCIFLCFPNDFPVLSKKTAVLYIDSVSFPSSLSSSGMDPAKTWMFSSFAILAISFKVLLLSNISAYSMNFSFSYGQLNISGRTAKYAPCFFDSFIIWMAFLIFFSLLSTTFIWQRAILIVFMFFPRWVDFDNKKIDLIFNLNFN